MAKRRKYKRITKELIRGYFGEDAKISWFGCPWRVKTLTGGEALISQREIKIIFGTEDVYRGAILLVGECWGGAVAHPGSNEFMLASVMHGEAAGVPIRADCGQRNAGLVQALVFGFILYVGCMMGGSDALPITLLVAVACRGHGSKRQTGKAEETRTDQFSLSPRAVSPPLTP